jgi:hypothetical protein
MATLGRKSVAALSVVAGMIDERPQPLEDLTEFQREVWQRTVASEVSTFFKTAALQGAASERYLKALPTPTSYHAPRASRGHPRPPGDLKVSAVPTRTAPAVTIR